jgi:fused signal recognition particle receptor
MAFNWFRRQSNDSSQTPPSSADNPPTEEVKADTEVATAASPDTGVDLLAFAKAAYKNIQDNIQENMHPQADVDVGTVTENVSPVEEEVQPDVQVVETVPEEVVLEGVIPSENLEPSTGEISEVSESIEDIPIPGVNTENLSFIERAAAEKQAKQERLLANAIEVTEPIQQNVVSPSTSASNEAIPDVVFDDGFLWSAEILAAQGRRAEDVTIEEITWLRKLRQGLDKTRRGIINQLKSIVGQGPLNQAAVVEIESLLLQADVGVEATDFVVEALQKKLREETLPPDVAIAYLKQILRDMLEAPIQKSSKASFGPEKDSLNIWLMTGVNGAGKTTTVGKLAHLSQKSGYKTLIGAADTFRAAAVEQVQVWGNRSGVEVICNPGKNTDPAAVVFDAIAAANARDTELLIIDTAGRLQNKKNLMEELSKVRRIIDKKAPNAKVESLLVLDATLGQNGLRQAEVFSEAAQLSGVVLTKLDGTAKGGVALAVVKQLGLPIRFIGAGEGIEDLRPFSSYEFVEALLSD